MSDDFIRSWSLTLRDLCDAGALAVTVTLPGGLTISYGDGAATVLAGGAASVLPDAVLDDAGLVLAEVVDGGERAVA